MKKKIFLVGLILCVSTITSYAKISIGTRLPFQTIINISKPGSGGETIDNEMWIGGTGMIEYALLQRLGIELGITHLMSLGGKNVNTYYDNDNNKIRTEYKYKNNIIPISLLLKFYMPIGKKDSSSTNFYFAGGPQMALITGSQEIASGDYQKTHSLRGIGFGFMGLVAVPTLKIGIDHNITESTKFDSSLEVGFYNEFYEESKDNTTLIALGLGLGLKYCF